MNLQELFDATITDETEARVRNTKTAIRVLAKALGYDTPTLCPKEAYNLPLSRISHLIDRHLQGKGPHTIRNTKNYLSKLFRSAAEKNLLSLVPSQLTRQFTQRVDKKREHRPGSIVARRDGTYFRFAQWPPSLQKEWGDLFHWCTAPLIEGRPASQIKRPTTVNSRRLGFESFFGYLIQEKHLAEHTLSFNHLFTFPLVRDYVHWHVNVRHHKVTYSLLDTIKFLKTLSHTYKPNAEFHRDITQLRKTLPEPLPTYNKEDAWVSLATIRQIATSLWPTKQPKDSRVGGTLWAMRAGLSLMFHLWCCIPYRQRNMREMELGKNLYKNTQGKWMLHFEGEQLKVAYKNGKLNVFELPFPEHLVSLLEQYLNVWRPCLLTKRGTPSTLVFLNTFGNAFTKNHMTGQVKYHIYAYTGVSFHPHLIRTIWATEYLKKTGDLYRTAVMLNDTLETVVKKYAHLSHQGVAEHVYRIMQDSNDPAPLPSTPRTISA